MLARVREYGSTSSPVPCAMKTRGPSLDARRRATRRVRGPSPNGRCRRSGARSRAHGLRRPRTLRRQLAGHRSGSASRSRRAPRLTVSRSRSSWSWSALQVLPSDSGREQDETGLLPRFAEDEEPFAGRSAGTVKYEDRGPAISHSSPVSRACGPLVRFPDGAGALRACSDRPPPPAPGTRTCCFCTAPPMDAASPRSSTSELPQPARAPVITISVAANARDDAIHPATYRGRR